MNDKINRLNKSIKIFLNYLIGPILFFWLAYNVVLQIKQQPDLGIYLNGIKEQSTLGGFVLFSLVVVFMFIQWIAEAKKWQLLMNLVSPISLTTAVKAIFSGISFSIATPNRIGEFAGRILHLPAGSRLQGTSFTFVGNFSQLIVTLIFGSFSLFFISTTDVQTFSIFFQSGFFIFFKILIPILTLLMILMYFKLGVIFEKLFSVSFLIRMGNKLSILKEIPNTILLQVLLLSIFRFFIFFIQYQLLFYLMDVGIGAIDLFIGISILFLLLSAVPTIAFVELGLRWQFALILFGGLSSNKLGISIAMTTVWFVNLMLPAFLGALSMISFNGIKTKN